MYCGFNETYEVERCKVKRTIEAQRHKVQNRAVDRGWAANVHARLENFERFSTYWKAVESPNKNVDRHELERWSVRVWGRTWSIYSILATMFYLYRALLTHCLSTAGLRSIRIYLKMTM